MTATNIAATHPHQKMIDRTAARLLRLERVDAEMVRATAWQIAKDAGYDDWREAMPEALETVGVN